MVTEDAERDYRGNLGTTPIAWSVDKTELTFIHIVIGYTVEYAERSISLLKVPSIHDEIEWDFSLTLHPNSEFHDLFARVLYRLGFEEESVLSQLPTLSMHEKLELRLSMPREFWPKQWLDEEASNY
ncbi:hypothetical protein IAD21_00251 [Abditibacteriota bacterium]|nr:hypothetical protein IAD21_00251 [Abditibacteriota bacterium]